MRRIAIAGVVSMLALAPAASFADPDHHEQKAPEAAARTDKDAFLFVYDDAAKKLRSLAEAIPADKYGWRPAEGVRSVGEAFLHAGMSIYLLGGFAGATLPEGAPKGFEETLALEKKADKATVVASLDKALDFGRQMAIDATPEMLEKPLDFFGTPSDGRTMFLLLVGHLHEHLGQEIAYARSIGVTPPWSQQQPKAE